MPQRALKVPLSIDESFLDFTGVKADLLAIGRDLRRAVLREIGLPTCVGFGSTKTLAKLANHIAKTAERKPDAYPTELARVCNLSALSAPELDAVFGATEVRSIWGVGRRIAGRLNESGIVTVLDLVRADAQTLRRQFNVVLEETVLELRGTSCIEMADVPVARQQILVSRSFGKTITEMDGIAEAVSEFVSRAAEKLREQRCLAGAVNVFFMTSPHRDPDRQHTPNVTCPWFGPRPIHASL